MKRTLIVLSLASASVQSVSCQLNIVHNCLSLLALCKLDSSPAFHLSLGYINRAEQLSFLALLPTEREPEKKINHGDESLEERELPNHSASYLQPREIKNTQRGLSLEKLINADFGRMGLLNFFST